MSLIGSSIPLPRTGSTTSSFLDHVLFTHVPEYHLRFRLLEQSRYFAWVEDIEVHVLELPKFTKSADQLESSLDRWLYFLRNAAMMDTEAVPAALIRSATQSAA